MAARIVQRLNDKARHRERLANQPETRFYRKGNFMSIVHHRSRKATNPPYLSIATTAQIVRLIFTYDAILTDPERPPHIILEASAALVELRAELARRRAAAMIGGLA